MTLPDAYSPAFRQAVSFFQQGKLPQANALLHDMPERPETAHLLGLIAYQSGQHAEAIRQLTRALALDAGNPEYWCHLGMAHAATGQLEEAVAGFRQALSLRPDHVAACNNLATALRDQGRLEDAVAAYQDAIRLNPGYVLAYRNLGQVFYGQRRFADAVACFEKAVSLTPDSVDALSSLGNAHAQLGQAAAAQTCYAAVLTLDPANVEALNNLGNAYVAQGKFDTAIDCFEQALALRPDTAGIHVNRGKTFFFQGKTAEAAACFERALALDPTLAVAHNNLGAALNAQGKPAEALEHYRQALHLKPDYAEAYSNLLLTGQYAGRDEAAQLAEHIGFAERFETPLRPAWRAHANGRDVEKRLKIGYVSADFRRHPVASFMEPILAGHDKRQLEVFCYYNHALQDDVTARMQSYADHWRHCSGWSDDELAARIRADRIDILVDLSGHTAGNRLLTFARKPAPLQLTYLGYPGTSGLAAMDYRITDRHADPQDAQRHYRERLLRLPDSLCCYPSRNEMPPASPLPALENGYLTFGSFNNSNKIDLQSLQLWARILNALPDARMLMAAVPEGERRQWLARQFEQLGVAAHRLEFHGMLASADFHRMFHRVDIALDPLLITGGTTTCESLHMGVPVVLLIGERYINRVGYSFLCAAGMERFAAPTAEAYVDIATGFAGRVPQLAQLRQEMRARLAASPLMDQARFTANLETLYRSIWQAWCRDVQPDARS